MSEDSSVDAKDCVKELVATLSFKQEQFSSLDENDKNPVQISRLEGAHFLFQEQADDTDIKSEAPLEDCRPVLKELVAVAPDTPEKGRALAEDCVKELVATLSFKQEQFSSLDENDKNPVQISRLEGAHFLFQEQADDTDIKSEAPLEDCRPVLKELVAVAPDTPEKGRALAEDCLKELVATRSFKQEQFSSLDENDKNPVQISRLEGAHFLFQEQADDTDIKSEAPLEDCRPVLKELVAVAPGTPEKGRALAEVKTEPDGHFSDVNADYESNSLEAQCENETEDRDGLSDNFQEDITKYSHSLLSGDEELHRQNAKAENASPIDTEVRFPKTTQNNLRSKEQKSASCLFQETHFCDLCGKSFGRKYHLIRHMINHMNKQPYVCNVCGLTFSRTDSLRRHRAIHVTGGIHRSHTCDVCGKGFTDRHNLKRHCVVHGNQKAHVCDRCGKTFTQLGDMKKHATVHTGRKLQKCDTCGKSFQKRTSLVRHQVNHSKDKLLYCDFCGKGFTRKDCLHSHMLQHMPQKPFICKYCGKGYTKPAPLQAHIYQHLDQKPFSCADCEKCFTSAATLRQHSFKIHPSQKSSEDTKLQQT